MMLLLDLRFAIRQLRVSPLFTLTAILTLSVGIGATTAVFSLVEGILLRPLPFSDPDRLVLVGDHLGGNSGISVTAREIGTYANAASAFSAMGGYISETYELSGEATPEQVHAARFTAGVFPTLGVRPIRGRVFSQKEEEDHQPVAVISYALWLTRYHRDPDILGKSIELDRRMYSIIGVMPRNFEFPLESGKLEQAQLWVPMSLSAEELSDEHAGFWGYEIVARVKGIALSQAAQDADRVAQQFARMLPASQSSIRLQGDVQDLRESDIEEVRPVLRALLLAVTVVLLIACANVAGLSLVRAIRRRREYAVRLALGAGTGSVLRETIFEGLLLSISGALLGLVLAAAAIRVALALLPDSMPRIDSISIDAGVAGFAFAIAVATGLACSLAPGFVALRTNISESLKEGLQSGTGRSSHTWLRSALVVAEIAIALVLITASAAFLRSFQKMRAVDPGFRPDYVVVAGFQLPLSQYPTQASADLFSRGVLEKLTAKPGVRAAAIASAVPGAPAFAKAAYTVEGETASNWKLRFAAFISTYGDYFQAMRIPLMSGRYFTDADRSGAPLVMIVNESMAKQCWPGESAIGKHMHAGGPTRKLPWMTVVGVVADTKGSRDFPSMEQWYVPASQPAAIYGSDFDGKLTGAAGGYITLRSALPAEQEVHTLRQSVAEVDPLLALDQAQPMTDVLSNNEAPRRFNTDLITAFAFAGLLLAVTGIYGVVAFSVARRAQEIAIRMALGEQRVGIVRLVLTAAAKLAILGCALGLLGSLAASRVISSFLFEVSATEPLIYGAAVALMIVMTLLASLVPASRAAGTDPNTILRAA
jgi:putative ABC transport system permease protein